MMNIRIVSLGKIKDTYWKDAEAEYLKRMKPYAKIEWIELTEESFREGDDRDQIKKKEADKLAQYCDGFVIALHEYGKEMSSVSLANFLEEQSQRGGLLTFLIGGPLGLHDEIIKKADLQLSLSQLTFPHQMVRVLLAEQLYRAATIQHGKQYHY